MANQYFRNRSPREHFPRAFCSGSRVSRLDDDGNEFSSIIPYSDNGLSAQDFSIKSQLASGKFLDPVSVSGLTFSQIDKVNSVSLPNSDGNE